MKRIILYAVILLVIVGGVLLWAMSRDKATSLPTVSVRGAKSLYLVAGAPLEAGRFIPTNNIAWKELDQDEAQTMGLRVEDLVRQSNQSREMLSGAVPRRDLEAGNFIPESALVKPSESDFLPSVLKPGYRAVAIGVTDVTGGAGLFRPGNTVDVLLTTSSGRRAASKKSGTPNMTKTLMQGVRILAFNRDIGIATVEDDKDKKKSRHDTVTLEVLPKQAEVLALAGTMGELSLSLCSTGTAVASGDLSETRSADILPVVEDEQQKPAKSVKTLFGTAKLEMATK